MSTESNRTVVRRFLEEVWSKGNLDLADELCTPDVVDHNPLPDQTGGVAGQKQAAAIMRSAFDDMRITIEDMVAEGDKVVDRWTGTAVHRGPILGIQPTGRRVTVAGIDIIRLSSGRIAEIWHQEDMLGLLQQLGAVPSPGQSQQKAA